MEPQYLLMKALLMFIVLCFGFILLLYSELLRLHDREKISVLIFRITGVVLILFFLIFSDLVKISWEFVFDFHRTSDERRQVYTFSQDVAIWKKGVSESSFLLLLVTFVVWFIFAFVGLFGMFMDFDIRKELKELDIFNVGRLAFFGVGIAISLLFGIFSLFQLGSFTMAIGYKLFY
jgi:hypothetical protein